MRQSSVETRRETDLPGKGRDRELRTVYRDGSRGGVLPTRWWW